MRFHRRLVFNPPLAAPIEERAENVRAALSRHGFVNAARSGTRIDLDRIPSVITARSVEEMRARVIVDGTIHLHASGSHADLELECKLNHVVLAAMVSVVLVIAPVQIVIRAFALAYAVWAILDLRRGVTPVVRWIASADRAQLSP